MIPETTMTKPGDWPPPRRAGRFCRPPHHSLVIGHWPFVILTYLLLSAAAMADRQALRGHVPNAVRGLASFGRLSASNRLDFVIGLPLRNRDTLTNFLEQLYDPASTNFHRYLTPEQFAERFGPTAQD